jgi:Lipid A 3-O-deacylase (PagL)
VFLASPPARSQEPQTALATDNPPTVSAPLPADAPPENISAARTETPAETGGSSDSNDAMDLTSPADMGAATTTKIQTKPPVESEIIWEGMASYGNYNLFAIEDMTKLYTSGVEYDRHSWGYFLKAQMDYVGEILPFVLLVEPAKSDYWGNPQTTNRKLVPGLSINPIGLRMMWRSNKQYFKPYVIIKGGMIGFTQKVLSNESSYEDFTLQSGFGVQTKLTRRVDLRLGLWGDFHFSNAYIVSSDPGTDVMNASWGICYHLGQPRQ